MTEYVRLGDVASINPPKKLVSHLADETVVGFIPMDAVSNEGKMERIDTRKYSEVKKGFVYFADGDILFAKITPCMENGKGAIVSGMPNGIGFGSTEFHVVRPNNGMTYERYIHYFLKNPSLRKLLENKMTGSAGQKRVSKDTLKELIIPLPPLAEQKRIAAALDTMSSVISRRKRQIELLDEAAKSLFVEMFGDPVENPMGWDVVALSECLESIDNGKSFVCDSEKRKGISPAVLKLSAATYGYYQPEENKAIISESQFIEKAEVHAGDLLFTRKNTPELVGMCAYVFSTPEKLMMPDLIFRLNTNDCCNKLYLWRLINHSLFRERVRNLASGSAKSMSNISKKSLNNLEIPLPPIELQNLFAARIEALEAQRASCERGLKQMETAFAAMMQEYFG